MQRYHAAGCTSAVNNSAIGGTSARDTSRVDPSSLPTNFSLNQRRLPQLTSYKLKCDKEPLNSRLGPPDFHPQTPNCPEETLTREYVQSGYRETVEGLEETREISLSQVQTFTKPVILKCKEAIRKCHRAINESRAQKRKAGQVYGVPLSGTLLTKPGVFPEQRPCGEDFRRKWIEGLSQPHKRLRSLSDHVPHGYRKKSLFEVLIRNNVPLLRATWFIKVTYLNQVRPVSASIASGVPDKTQFARTEQWTKDVIDYLQCLLDEFVSRNASHSNTHVRERSPHMVYVGSLQHKSDTASAVLDGDEPSIHFKWWYVVRILQWHHAEGLLLPSLIIDWVLNQLQEKDLLGTLQLLLPILYGVIESVVLSQTYVRTVVGLAVRFIQEPSPGGSHLVDNSRRAYTMSAMVEMLRYMILAVPDTFVALDCFPLPPYVVSHVVNDGNFLSKVSDGTAKINSGSVEAGVLLKEKVIEPQHQSFSIDCVVSSIQKCANNLAMAARPGYPGRSVAKAVQELDKALVQGDVRMAYSVLFKDLCEGAVNEGWVAEVSPCLRSSLKWIGTVSLSFVCPVFVLCEWATCDFRDFRTAPPCGMKFTGGKDFSQVYLAIRLLKLKIKDMQSSLRCKNDGTRGVNSLAKGPGQLNNYSGRNFVGIVNEHKSNSRSVVKSKELSNIFESPGPLHDIIVCWLDQHEVQNGEGFKRLQLLIVELTRSGIFYPQAYVRQLIVSGIMDGNGLPVDLDRRKRHYKILKQLPGSYIRDALEEAQITEMPVLLEATNIYSNERRLLLNGLIDHHKNPNSADISSKKQKHHLISGGDGASPHSVDQWRTLQPSSRLPGKSSNRTADIEELKTAISVLLQLPNSSCAYTDIGMDESQGSVKSLGGSMSDITDLGEGTPGCEECRRAKRQKLSDERSSYIQGNSANSLDDEESWWVRKGLKPMEALKTDPPLKPAKQSSRGRQKIVRKTQSLAQLGAARIEGSQGASTSHICDSRVSCPHHGTGFDGETPKSMRGIRTPHSGDIVSIGKILKQLRFVEKRFITIWLVTVVRQLVEENEKAAAKVGQYGRPFPSVDDKTSLRWKLGEDELSAILYLIDISNDLVSAARFLLWLLPKVLSSPNSAIHGGRNVLMLPRNVGTHACEVGEAFLLSSIRRYENILVATELLPETLSAMMHRATTILASNGRVSGSVALVYARYLLKKYASVVSVVEWEKNFKATCDKRLLPELESGRSLDGELVLPLGVPAGVEDLDDFLRQKISGGRVSRVGLSMREMVHRQVEEAVQYFYGKERKLFAAGTIKGPTLEKGDDGYQMAQQIVIGLMDCMRQTGGAAQEGDPSLVSSAVSAIFNSIGPVVAKLPDLTASGNHPNFPSSAGSLTFARRILRSHITCLYLLKEALGERQSRVFEIALATEASSALAQAFAPGKAPRGQFQLSPEAHDSNANSSNEHMNSSAKAGRAAKIAAAVSALVIGAILHGVASLERMVTVFKLKEGLDVIQFLRTTRSNSNGNARSVGAFKADNVVEISAHWFRVLVGNCRTVSDGLIMDLLGEASVVALSRMQRTLPLSLIFPPAYSIFAFVIWRPYIFNTSIVIREDIHQLYQCLVFAIGDAIKHLPFRDVCLRDTREFYDLVVADATDSEFAAMLELNGAEMHMKAMAFVPLRARLFLNAIIDCKMPQSMSTQDDGNRVDESGVQYAENETKLLDKLVHVLDTLQPAKFHWQWVELRFLLNEQALIEKLDSHDTSLVEAIRSSSPNPDKGAASENENNFIEIILTRLLVRPDAAPLFSEVIHLFGRSLEDSMLLQAKWFLGGPDVLFGRKSIRQRLINIAESKGLSTKAHFRKPWGWCYSNSDLLSSKGDVRKFETSSLEEGEVVEEGAEVKRLGSGSTQVLDVESSNICQQYITERALIELVLSCIDQSSDDSRSTFASDLIKQMTNIEQQINAVTRGASKQGGAVNSGSEGTGTKSNNRKGMRGGSPGLARRSTVTADIVPPSPAALRASMSLRLQFLVRLLPIICADGEPSARNMRHMLASVVLRLLGSRVVHEVVEQSLFPMLSSSLKTDVDLSMEDFTASAVDLSGESLFNRLLLVLHGLLSSSRPRWLKSKKDFSVFDREVAESLQNDLDRMHLPDSIRWRIQAAMPTLFPSFRWHISCQPPSVSPAALASLQPSISVSGSHPGNSNLPQRNPGSLTRTATSLAGKTKPSTLQQDIDMEIDPWTLLEDGAGSGPSSTSTSGIGGSDNANLRASSLLKGAVRVRRTDLTYIGVVDDDS
ncbi:LOW QUALITY PROTEIN: mediator of RNA polymerase II transcription subunit 12-like [Actinidia eriantha]|uniref:LOW QUALITY PROTEIN: mediator of RNA polymerase II transcription subunit 12-like n=1 Tax=Actinidia eriantha TaxID=165200 RepID=UPI00258DDE8E|nr:LOW QUALITY PROTEIN: mediator of RNA polymerase II transcription subunit 12-like [Actinidia eriantha]